MTSTDDHSSETKSAPLMKRLRESTKSYHAKLESLPYFDALIDHQLPLASYVSQLRALAVVHGVLENELANTDSVPILSVWDDTMRKLGLLNSDLAFFKPRVISDDKASLDAALAMTEKIRLRQIENPNTLLGYLYVFEGSTLGNAMHRPDVTQTFQLNDMDGCQYYASYQDQVQSCWQKFSQKMNQVSDDDTSLQESIIEAAHEAFQGLEVLYTTLYPLAEGEKSLHVTRINPEAGNHPIPDDEREIQAALKASDRAWADFPYYEHRYGERGKRFSDSDTCWLVTLTAMDQQAIQKQIDWLCRVLATRGMPTVMMERTLRYLHEELSNAIPDSVTAYDKLSVCAQALKDARQSYIPNTEFQSLADKFEQTVGSEMAGAYKDTGQLLVAAVADEANGIQGAVAALREWLTEGGRFSDAWIRAVNETIQIAERNMS